MSSKRVALGIDLGTTYTKAYVFVNKEPRPVKFKSGLALPSIVAYQDEFFRKVQSGSATTASPGDAAKYIFVGHDAQSKIGDHFFRLFDAKRFLGNQFDSHDVKRIIDMGLPFRVVGDKTKSAVFRVVFKGDCEEAKRGDYFNVDPVDVSAEVLKMVMKTAQAQCRGAEFDPVVITVPAKFSDAQRVATEQAAQKAGIKNLKLLFPEPTAAALAYYCRNEEGFEKGTYVVFDFGGGTLDISVVSVDPARMDFRVLAVEGDILLGGRDIDELLVSEMRLRLKESLSFEESKSMSAERKIALERRMLNLREEVHYAKLNCNDPVSPDVERVEIQNSSIEPGLEGHEVIDGTLIRDCWQAPVRRFTEACRPPGSASSTSVRPLRSPPVGGPTERVASMEERAIECLDKALAEAKITKSDLKGVLLAGGSSNLHCARDTLRAHFGTGVPILEDSEVQSLVAYGACLRAYYLTTSKDVRSEVKASTSDSSHDSGDAALPSLCIQEALPHSLGIETLGNNFSRILSKNQNYPACNTETYRTSCDNQTSVSIRVLLGEDPRADQNALLDVTRISGIPPKPAGQAKLTVKFAIDESGILRVATTVLDTASQTEWECKVTFADRDGADRGGKSRADAMYEPERQEVMDRLTRLYYSVMHMIDTAEVGNDARLAQRSKVSHYDDWIHGFHGDSLKVEELREKYETLQKLKEGIAKELNSAKAFSPRGGATLNIPMGMPPGGRLSISRGFGGAGGR